MFVCSRGGCNCVVVAGWRIPITHSVAYVSTESNATIKNPDDEHFSRTSAELERNDTD